MQSTPIKPKKFLTNVGENTVSKRLESILPKTQYFDCLVGYFFISGFFRLYPALEPVKKIRILIGMKNEQVIHGLVQIANNGLSEITPSTSEIKKIFGNMMRKELIQAQDSSKIENGIRTFIEWIRSGKLEVKLYRDQNIHAKIYIMTPEPIMQDVNHGYVITGSSNFSHSGLEGNLEFNVLLQEPEDHDYALHRFNELWENAVDVQDVHDTIIATVEKESPFAIFSPYELYLKFLADYFRDYLVERSKLTAENLPPSFKKLQYQEDAVFTAQHMLKTYGGVFIADVVGLGKTYMSALLALQLGGRCLVIAPPSLLDENSPGSWPRIFRDFCIPGHKCVSIGKLEEALDQGIDFYKYVFIDESHRFKGDSTQRYEIISRICQNKGVILVSATPYNNTLDDIYSQLKLFQPPRKSTIPGVRNLEAFFDKLRNRIKNLHRVNDADAYIAAVEENAHELRESVLKYIMVRRTRSEITEFYGADLKAQKISFPTVSDPVPLLYQLNSTESVIFLNTLETITSSEFHYARYKPLDPLYYNGPMEDRPIQGQRNLATFMKILLVKRLESSFYAFRETLNRFINSHEIVLRAFDEGSVYTSQKHSRKVLEFLEIGDDDAIDAIESLIREEKAERFQSTAFHPLFRQHVESDLNYLYNIRQSWTRIVRDPKWIQFKNELQSNSHFKKGKLIIFSEFADTARHLAEFIKAEVETKTLLFDSKSSPYERQVVIANFDPNIQEQSDDYRILVTTDVLAEGVNLHRSATVINYDIPWNPSRMMQRVGRVNRVGTKAKAINTYNFFPTDEGDDEIALTEAARSKIHAFITLLGNDARLLTGDEEITSHNLFDRINSKEATEGSPKESKSELKYLRKILDIKENQPELFKRILALPQKARSSRAFIPKPTQNNHSLTATRPALITYLRQGLLDKFFLAHGQHEDAIEIDFFTIAEILETTEKEQRREIPSDHFYPLLEKNKKGFQELISPTIEASMPARVTSGSESTILKRLRTKNFRTSNATNAEDRKFTAQVQQLISDGRIGKIAIKKIKSAFDQTDNPVEMVAILRREIAPQYLVPPAQKQTNQENQTAPSEIILSSYLP